MLSKTACVGNPYSIQGHSFVSDFRLLDVQGHDIILGADWIYTHSLVDLNVRTRDFSITKEGKDIITFSGETLLDRNVLISTKKLCKLLKKKKSYWSCHGVK